MNQFRVLGIGDEDVFKSLRLQALQKHPEAFGASYADEVDMPVERVRERLTSGLPDNVTVGLFVGGELCGMLAAQRIPREKLWHVVTLGGMYIAPEQRGLKLGQALLDFVLDHCRTVEGVRMVRLAVTVGNNGARKLYRQAGFVTWGVEPAFIRVGDVFHDIEWMTLRL